MISITRFAALVALALACLQPVSVQAQSAKVAAEAAAVLLQESTYGSVPNRASARLVTIAQREAGHNFVRRLRRRCMRPFALAELPAPAAAGARAGGRKPDSRMTTGRCLLLRQRMRSRRLIARVGHSSYSGCVHSGTSPGLARLTEEGQPLQSQARSNAHRALLAPVCISAGGSMHDSTPARSAPTAPSMAAAPPPTMR